MNGRSLALLLDRKRRILAEYLTASDEMLLVLAQEEPIPEDLTPFLERRESAVRRIKRLDKSVATTESSDPAAEIVAGAALRRTLERASRRDASLREALAAWHTQFTRTLGGIVRGRRSLRAYRGGTPAPVALVRQTG